MKQVHGTGILDADEVCGAGSLEEADGIVVRREGMLAAVATADCVPVLLVASTAGGGPSPRRWAACLHAGWRGTLAGIVVAAVGRAAAAGFAARDLLAALGPSIGPCCYEVGEEVASGFRARGLPVVDAGGRVRLDLREVNRRLLERCGLAAGRIQSVGPCTRCRRDRYHSYRADPSAAGRQLSWIGWESAFP